MLISDDEYIIFKNSYIWCVSYVFSCQRHIFDYDFQIKTQLQKLEEQLEKISKKELEEILMVVIGVCLGLLPLFHLL